MRHERLPSDLAALDGRVRRAVDARVDDVDALWVRIGAAIDADVVVPLRGRPRRRTTALLLAASLALGGSALAGLGVRDGTDPPLERGVIGLPPGGSGPDDRKGSRWAFASGPDAGGAASDDEGSTKRGGHPEDGTARPDPPDGDGQGEDDDVDHEEDPPEWDEEDQDEDPSGNQGEGEDGSGDEDGSGE